MEGVNNAVGVASWYRQSSGQWCQWRPLASSTGPLKGISPSFPASIPRYRPYSTLLCPPLSSLGNCVRYRTSWRTTNRENTLINTHYTIESKVYN